MRGGSTPLVLTHLMRFGTLGTLSASHGRTTFQKLATALILGWLKSRQKGNDQELIQSSSTSRPKRQTGQGQAQPRRHLKLEQWKADGAIFPNRWLQDYPK